MGSFGVLSWLESSAFFSWLRESPSLLAYPLVLFLHAIGLVCTAGPSTVISLRLLGVGRQLPVAPLDRFFPLIWIGFWTSAVSGFVMLAVDATTKLGNPLFGVKMVFVAASVALMVLVRRRVKAAGAGGRETSPGRWLALASLVCWAGAIAAGRFMAFL
jgi:hypothetical protein